MPYDGSDSAKKIIDEIKAKIQADPDCALETCLLCWVIDDSGRLPSENQAQAAQTELDTVKAELEGFGTEIKTQVVTEVRTGNTD